MIQQKSLNFNSKLGGNKEFQASSGWLEKFKNDHGIRQLSIVGEKLSSDIEAGNSFIAELQDLIVKENLTADQIYNCDETGLCWRALPTKTLAAENEAVVLGQKKDEGSYDYSGMCQCFWLTSCKADFGGKE
ncbi:Jerky -like [Araneus ventricosus]|uniref:Jerky-like n=1 Tax=Araneus ventricosus TaxID=182803 RepID=A0A4Y2M712_ARAVE|nr:Jerky -like [Araneus ventricosus]